MLKNIKLYFRAFICITSLFDVAFADQISVKSLHRELGFSETLYDSLCFYPTADAAIKDINDLWVDRHIQEHKRCLDSGDVFCVPEFKALVQNMIGHLEFMHNNPKTGGIIHEDFLYLKQKLTSLKINKYPYKTVILTFFQFVHVINKLAVQSYYQPLIDEALLRHGDSQDRSIILFGCKSVTFELNSIFRELDNNFKPSISFNDFISLNIHDLSRYDFSIIKDSDSIASPWSHIDVFKNLMDNIDNSEIIFYPTYNSLSIEDFNKLLVRRNFFFIGTSGQLLNFHDGTFMGHSVYSSHDIRHFISIITFRHCRYYDCTVNWHTGCPKWGTWSNYNKTPLIIRDAFSIKQLTNLDVCVFEFINDYMLHENLTASEHDAHALINFDILHESPIPYNGLLEMTKEDLMQTINRIEERRKTHFISYKHVKNVDLINVATAMLLARDQLIERWEDHVPVTFSHHSSLPRINTHCFESEKNDYPPIKKFKSRKR